MPFDGYLPSLHPPPSLPPSFPGSPHTIPYPPSALPSLLSFSFSLVSVGQYDMWTLFGISAIFSPFVVLQMLSFPIIHDCLCTFTLMFFLITIYVVCFIIFFYISWVP